MGKTTKYRYSEDDYAYMRSLSSAVLENTPKKTSILLWFWIVIIIALISWASITEIDEIVRGQGKIIPSSENQMIQNLEGGIVKEILVSEGDFVKAGDILIKIGNQKSQSSYESNYLKSLELKARIVRLTAESNNKSFVMDKNQDGDFLVYVAQERKLYNNNQDSQTSKINILKEQLVQKKNSLAEARISIKYLQNELKLINEEVEMSKPLVAKGIRSKVDYLKLQRDMNNIEKELKFTKNSIPRYVSSISEVKNTIVEADKIFISLAQEELNKALAELERVISNMHGLKDEVDRKNVYATTNGIIQRVFFNTIGGVIQPGADLVEIVPTDDSLLVEAKVKPSDIAFLFSGQAAKVKFTAYDFAIYGGLDGKVIKISADTEVDRDENSFYKVLIKTDKNYLVKNEHKLPIMPGMIVSIDILTGKKTIMDYILKPILRAKQYTFTER
ncbi:MAG: HlyD family type I secretion periplasmic adaptor subunit [Campylobacterota bacterium]|nr:HlyD family type I secretion periplasmic adaptor subunit [Campylobacterota bacterium]